MVQVSRMISVVLFDDGCGLGALKRWNVVEVAYINETINTHSTSVLGIEHVEGLVHHQSLVGSLARHARHDLIEDLLHAVQCDAEALDDLLDLLAELDDELA